MAGDLEVGRDHRQPLLFALHVLRHQAPDQVIRLRGRFGVTHLDSTVARVATPHIGPVEHHQEAHARIDRPREQAQELGARLPQRAAASRPQRRRPQDDVVAVHHHQPIGHCVSFRPPTSRPGAAPTIPRRDSSQRPASGQTFLSTASLRAGRRSRCGGCGRLRRPPSRAAHPRSRRHAAWSRPACSATTS